MNNNFVGKKCIVRGDRSGVFFGTVREIKGSHVLMENVRRVWYWSGAASISQLAVDGTSDSKNCKITVSVENVGILDAIEINECTNKAIASLEGVACWKR